MGLNLSLDFQKQAIIINAATQNAMKKQNSSSSNNIDTTASRISIFSAQIEAAIREQARKCNDVSSQVAQKNQNQVVGSCSDVNSNVADLQSLVSWTGSASQEIAGISGISDSAISSLNSSMGSAIQYGLATINNTVARANEALSKINVSKNNSLGSVVTSVKNNINTVAQNAAVTGSTATLGQGQVVTANQTGTAAATKTDKTAVDTTKTDSVKADTASVNTAKADTTTAVTAKTDTAAADTAKTGFPVLTTKKA